MTAQRQTEWTDVGHRLTIEVGQRGNIIFTCHSRAMDAPSALEQGPERVLWLQSQLAISHGVPRPEAGRLVCHWLAFYADAELSTAGLALFREVFDSIKERAAPPNENASGYKGGILH